MAYVLDADIFDTFEELHGKLVAEREQAADSENLEDTHEPIYSTGELG